jgi:anti-sigma regulatory factor (Ser/Thr protein kinase)
MEAVLIAQWLDGVSERIPIFDEASASLVREAVRAAASGAGLPSDRAARMVSAASELAMNALRHARHGVVGVRAIARGGVPGIEVVATDRGDGIRDVAAALRPASQEAKPLGASLGVGLAAVLELSDEVDFDVRLNEGACVRARKFAEPVARGLELGIVGRPHPEESVSGDQAIALRDDADGSLVVAVADGLGHGPLARAASDAAVHVVASERQRAPDAILRECEAPLAKTRGAVMGVAAIDATNRRVTYAGAGNVVAHVYGFRGTQRFGGSSSVLGSPRTKKSYRAEDEPIAPGEIFAMFTDGLTSRADLGRELEWLHKHPIFAAQALVSRFGRDNDDVLVLVAR